MPYRKLPRGWENMSMGWSMPLRLATLLAGFGVVVATFAIVGGSHIGGLFYLYIFFSLWIGKVWESMIAMTTLIALISVLTPGAFRDPFVYATVCFGFIFIWTLVQSLRHAQSEPNISLDV